MRLNAVKSFHRASAHSAYPTRGGFLGKISRSGAGWTGAFFTPTLPAQAIIRRQTARLIRALIERYGRTSKPGQMQTITKPSLIERAPARVLSYVKGSRRSGGMAEAARRNHVGK